MRTMVVVFTPAVGGGGTETRECGLSAAELGC